MIIALAGNMGVGKDTCANVLVKTYGFRRTAFAKALKGLAQEIFDYHPETLWGESALRNVSDPRAAYDSYWWDLDDRVMESPKLISALDRLFPAHLVPKAHAALRILIQDDFAPQRAALTPRHVLQRLGTEWGRALYPEVWLHAVKTEIDDHPGVNWVITDCRFPNEAEYVSLRLGGQTVWVDSSIRVAQAPGTRHVSEPTQQELAPWTSAVLDNNGPLADIAPQINALLSKPNA